jgi:ubiquinone biosynthesis protein
MKAMPENPPPLSTERAEEIARNVDLALSKQNGRAEQNGAVTAQTLPLEELHPAIDVDEEMPYFGPPPMSHEHYKVSWWQNFLRFLIWIRAVIYFLAMNTSDGLRGRGTEAQRAIRLREALEGAGGTLVKIGQQMSIRLDLLPHRYCYELAKMLDRVAPFPVEEARAIIERTLGQKLEEVFSDFDPNPVGSASIAVVYKARLIENGEWVAIKIRRPKIGQIFEADLNILDGILSWAEKLTLIPPGITQNVRLELREMLMEELNFKREARFQEIFKRKAAKVKNSFFTAPRLYFKYCNEELLVQEFVRGVWLSTVLDALEKGHKHARDAVEAYGIDPHLVAKRILYVNYWGMFENLFFHADPHPANILVQADNKLVFIDFGASGTINKPHRILYQKLFNSQAKDDAWQMAQAAVALLEPLTAVDINALAKELEAAFYENFLAFKSKQSVWYERTTANVWISFLMIARKYEISPPRSILLFARSRFLYDTLTARLSPRIDFYDEFQDYYKHVDKKFRKKLQKRMRRHAEQGLLARDYTTISNLMETGGWALHRVQRLLLAPYDFASLPYVVSKVSFILGTLINFILQVSSFLLLGLGIQSLINWAFGVEINILRIFFSVLFHPLFLGLSALALVINIRSVLYRLNYKVLHHF